MVAGLFTTCLLSLLLPIIVLAGPHGPSLVNRHHGLARRSEGNVQLYERQSANNARLSFYDAETGSAGSCGQFIKNSDFSVAMNVEQMQSAWCGQSILITWNGKQTTAFIKDTCPGCPWGGLDLTEGLFAFFAPQSVGILYGQWTFSNAAPAPAPPPPPAPSPTPTPTPTPPPPPPSPSPYVPPPSPSISIPTPSISIPVWTSTSTSNTPAFTPLHNNSTHNSTAASTSSSSTVIPSNSINYASSIASGLAEPTGSTVVTPESGNNIQDLYQTFIAFAGLITAAHNA